VKDREWTYPVTLGGVALTVTAAFDTGDASVGIDPELYLARVVDADGAETDLAALARSMGSTSPTMHAALTDALLAEARDLYAAEQARAVASEDAQAAHEAGAPVGECRAADVDLKIREIALEYARALLAIRTVLSSARSGALRGSGAEQSTTRAAAIEAALKIANEVLV
jgi:hypothetical protein